MHNPLEEKILKKQAVIGVVGMGYIGLSLLDAFGKAGFVTRGYDSNRQKVEILKRKERYLNFLDLDALFALMERKRFTPSATPSVLKGADILIISVPTSLDAHGTPDLTNLRNAFDTVATYQKRNQLVILQSSTYPGTTAEELLPKLTQKSFAVGKDFYLAHVPEIADIGNPKFSFHEVPRIVSGITPLCARMAEIIYQQIGCTTVRAASTTVAEAAKLLQNAFRLVNISFVNEMKMLLDKMNIDIWEVIEAAASKPFGFMPFYPGPGIGGDCIPIAPVYLDWKAKATGGRSTILEDAKRINTLMPTYVISKLIKGLNAQGKPLNGSKVLLLGVGYKKDVNDIRESPALQILPILKEMYADIAYHDPLVPEIATFSGYSSLKFTSVRLDYKKLKEYDAVVIHTDHSSYNWELIVKNSPLVIDTRNVTSAVRGVHKHIIRA